MTHKQVLAKPCKLHILVSAGRGVGETIESCCVWWVATWQEMVAALHWKHFVFA